MSSVYRTDDVCGSLAGHHRHRYRRELVCDRCREAWNAYQRDRYRRQAHAKWARQAAAPTGHTTTSPIGDAS